MSAKELPAGKRPAAVAETVVVCPTDTDASEESHPAAQNACPEERASFISRLYFHWSNGLLYKGFKGQLKFDDLPPTRSDALTARACMDLRIAWEMQRQAQGGAGKPSLYRAIWRVHRFTLAWSGICTLLFWGSAVGNPMLMRELLGYIVNPRPEPWRGYMMAVGLFLLPLVGSLFNNHGAMAVMRCGMVVRSALSAMVYRKALRLDSAARQRSTAGNILNLMSSDCQRFAEIAFFFHMIWVAPVVVLVVLALLIWVIGWQALVGVAVMFLLFPVNGALAAYSQKLRGIQSKISDERVATMNEVVQGIRVIKFYAWERHFAGRMEGVRRREVRLVLKQMYLRAMILFLMVLTPTLTAMATFMTYWRTVGRMDPARVFTALALFQVLRMPLVFLPVAIALLAQLHVAVKRLEAFLNEEETQQEGEEGRRLLPGEAPHVLVRGGTFSWDAPPPGSTKDEKKEKEEEGGEAKGGRGRRRRRKGAEDGPTARAPAPAELKEDGKEAPAGPTLQDIDFEARTGQLVAVAGPVGSGKSSLVAALLGDIRRRAGEARVAGRVALVAQQAWIVNATLRENVLFGEPYDEGRYRRTLAACALERDIAALPGGDQTEIGEKGINLSGGQKQRVSIARAVYADADVYILDDPLSAVDPHVGRHLFEECICGALRGKTRVLVTNQLHFLPQVDAVYVLKDGRVSEAGTYAQLVATGKAFSELMAAYGHGGGGGGGGGGGEGEGEAGSEGGAPSKADRASPAGAGGGAGAGARPDSRKVKEKGSLVEEEGREKGGVAWGVYWGYVQAAGGPAAVLPLLAFYVFTSGLQTGTDVWLSVWTGNQVSPDPGQEFYVAIYGGFVAAFCICACIRALAFAHVTVGASARLYRAMLLRVLRAPSSFFDTTPAGRILNRFSKDTDSVDQFVGPSAESFLSSAISLLAILILIACYFPWILVAFGPLGVVYFYVQRFYARSSTELQRMESVSKSPVYNNFSETLSGVSTIRAYAAQERFTRLNDERTDGNNRAYYMIQVASRWLSMRLDVLSALAILVVGLLAVNAREAGINPGSAGLVLSYSLSITQVLTVVVRFSAELEAKMNGVERQLEYARVPNEAAEVVEGKAPPAAWPAAGAVEVDRLVLRYRPGLEPVLKGPLGVRGGEKVGVVGRTGAGKSSLMLALFRLVEASEGRVVIDGVDVAGIGLRDLRSRLGIIPQDPVLFSGSVRENLDPAGGAGDEALWGALEACRLRPLVESLSGGLDAKARRTQGDLVIGRRAPRGPALPASHAAPAAPQVAEAGENLSVGQRQLVCLARAVLRKPRLLIMDEATASIDAETDAVIQRTIRQQFAGSTVLTIAHRLNTVMDSDRILVLDRGRVAEFDSPAALLARPDSVLSAMVDQTGPAAARHLRRVAMGEAAAFAQSEFEGSPGRGSRGAGPAREAAAPQGALSDDSIHVQVRTS
eukprot:tig00021494_g21913.t1